MLRLACVFALLVSVVGAAEPGYVGEIESWRAERLAALTAPESWLSLIGLHAVAPGSHEVGTDAANGIKLAAGPARFGTVTYAEGQGVTFAAAAGSGATIDGAPVTTAVLAYGADKPTVVRSGTVSFFVIERGGKPYLRVRDTASARREHFVGIDSFAIDPAWRIEAEWVPFDPPHRIPITNILGMTSDEPVPGKAVFTYQGHTIELQPVDEGTDELFFILTDLTAGEETYAAARFLYVPKPTGNRIVLDFNRTENPPCAFTPFATCPLPPKSNRLPFRLTAGEKTYRGEH